jgi:phosphoglycolate phosphatase-like HAD superfamily hydrolase
MTTVAFDVDGTLIGASDDRALEDIRTLLITLKRLGCRIVVWSGSGAGYAEMVARRIHIDHWVDVYRHKSDQLFRPDIAFDDEDVKLGLVNIRIP